LGQHAFTILHGAAPASRTRTHGNPAGFPLRQQLYQDIVERLNEIVITMLTEMRHSLIQNESSMMPEMRFVGWFLTKAPPIISQVSSVLFARFGDAKTFNHFPLMPPNIIVNILNVATSVFDQQLAVGLSFRCFLPFFPAHTPFPTGMLLQEGFRAKPCSIHW
jgi:hypothetical protein